MELTMSPEVQERIQRRLGEGHWTSASEVVSRALDLLDEKEADEVLYRVPAEQMLKLLTVADEAEARGALVTPQESRARLERLRAERARG